MNPPNVILKSYIENTPLALAFERFVEAKIYSELNFQKPILDIGCGEGLFVKLAFSEKFETGIDPNSRELARAKELGGYKELIQCWGDKIPKPDSSYQTVISNSVLEHIPDVLPVFREAFRVLSPGGRFYLTVPTNMFDKYSIIYQTLSLLGLKKLAAKYSQFFNSFWKHYHYYETEGWLNLAESAGFQVEKSQTYNSKGYCLLNDFLAPFGLFGMITKKIFNRWTLAPWLRGVIFSPIIPISRKLLNGAEHAQNGGLLFVSLQKPRA